MLHYRQTFRNNGSRLIIAAMLATVLHLGLMNIQLVSRPFLAPSVSLPRSVSIQLTPKSRMNALQQSVSEDISGRKNKLPVEEKKILPAVKKISAAPEADVVPVQSPPVVIEKEVLPSTVPVETRYEKPVVDTAVPAQKTTENSPVEVQHDENVSAETAEQAARTGTKTGDDENAALHSGVLQEAYPRYQLNDPPVYPNLARKRGMQGTVVLQVLVNGQGRVNDIRLDVSSGYSMLDRAASAAVKKWIFEPGRKGDSTVPMWVRVPVIFELKNR